jgi:hypothetical protein
MNCIICTLHQILLGNEVKEDKMSRTCNTHDGDEKFLQIIVGKPSGKTPFGRTRRTYEVNTRIDLKRNGGESVDWKYRAEDGNRWQVLVDTAMTIRVQ